MNDDIDIEGMIAEVEAPGRAEAISVNAILGVAGRRYCRALERQTLDDGAARVTMNGAIRRGLATMAALERVKEIARNEHTPEGRAEAAKLLTWLGLAQIDVLAEVAP